MLRNRKTENISLNPMIFLFFVLKLVLDFVAYKLFFLLFFLFNLKSNCRTFFTLFFFDIHSHSDIKCFELNLLQSKFLNSFLNSFYFCFFLFKVRHVTKFFLLLPKHYLKFLLFLVLIFPKFVNLITFRFFF